MNRERELKELFLLFKLIAKKESIDINYILNNTSKISKMYGLRLSENERRLVARFVNKNYGQKPFDINVYFRPKYDM